MALITCSECGGQMSDRAMECPHCGCPIEIANRVDEKDETVSPTPTPRKKGKWKIATIVLTVIVLLCTGAILYFKNEVFACSTLNITPEFTKALERYDHIDAFSEGLAAVHRDGKWGYINLKGEEVIPCQFSDVYRVGQFSEGVACVVDNRNKADSALWNKRIGFINKKGEWVLEGDFFTEAQCPYASMEYYADYLPSFKDGKVAVWDKPSTSDKWEEWDRDSKIILVDHKGKTYEVADSIGKELSHYQPYPNISNSEPNRIQAYDDYFISEYRDTLQCDNGARLITWSVMDANNLPYDTKEKTVRYFVDNYGNSTLTPNQSQAMEQHINEVIESLRRQHNQQLVAERQRQEEEERQRQREWLYGTWEFSGTIDMGRYLGGVKRVTSKLVITEDNLKVYSNGELEYNGSYEIEGNQIVYDRHNGYSSVLPFDRDTRRISLDHSFQGRYFTKTSNSTSNYTYSSNSHTNPSYSSTPTFRTESNVWAYLSSTIYYKGDTRFRITPRCIEVDWQPASNAVRLVSFSGSRATLQTTDPYSGQVLTLYINAANGSVSSGGEVYYAK